MSKQLSVKEQKQKWPRVFIGIPTGPTKLYSTYSMVAMLANLDYENMMIHWACTGGIDQPEFLDYKRRVTKLMEAVKWPEKTEWCIHYVPLTPMERATHYVPILRNKDVLRDTFLDSDAEYFLLLGGDNPPPRRAIKRLLEIDADIAMAHCYQRPDKDKTCGVYPLVWRYSWLPSDIDKLKDLDVRNREELRLAWLQAPSLISIAFDPKWKEQKVIWNITGGDGCALIKRRVLEMIDWGVRPDAAYHSEDVHFMSMALWYGFSTAVATDLHCPHMDPNGKFY